MGISSAEVTSQPDDTSHAGRVSSNVVHAHPRLMLLTFQLCSSCKVNRLLGIAAIVPPSIKQLYHTS